MTAEERMMWVERYSALPTGNVADAMDGLGLKRGSVLDFIRSIPPRSVQPDLPARFCRSAGVHRGTA